MTVVLLVVMGAVLIGYARGGSLATLSHLSLPGWPLVFLALAAQGLGALVAATSSLAPRAAYVAGLLVSAVLVTAFMVRNRHLRGVPLIAAGFVLNAAVVAANGAMPVSLWAARHAGIETAGLVAGTDVRHEVATDATRLRLLADVIPVPTPVDRARSVVSAGDVVLAAGIGVLVTNAMVRPGVGRRAQRLAAGT
ncbi:MAG TPA: DUF5317 domain-containing protein [Mycobacteriales bacterium]|nr:DUF5317 domain-containing protein [Mycobacteriales bacterium]